MAYHNCETEYTISFLIGDSVIYTQQCFETISDATDGEITSK